ncbi:hypothetical protein F4775DRAFT_537157 [Biscogniauxia sp. FL1348]|nr:hypothetical protein F4775DRAFT_537157 [Biscogniauxia sp. FL1348]
MVCWITSGPGSWDRGLRWRLSTPLFIIFFLFFPGNSFAYKKYSLFKLIMPVLMVNFTSLENVFLLPFRTRVLLITRRHLVVFNTYQLLRNLQSVLCTCPLIICPTHLPPAPLYLSHIPNPFLILLKLTLMHV